MAEALYKNHLTTTNSGTTPIPVNVPSSDGPAVGDWMVASIHTTASNSEAHAITAPSNSGWVQVLAPSLLGSRILSVFAKRRVDGDPNTWTFTQAKTGAAFADVQWGSGGVTDISTWLKGAFSKGANLTTQTTPGVSGAVAGSLAISIQAEATAATESDVMTVDSPFTKLYWTIIAGSNPINSFLIAHRKLTADGSTGDAVSRGWPNQTGNRGSFMLVIPPAVDATPTRLALKISDGQGNIIDGKVSWWDGSQEIQLAKVTAVYPGSLVPDLVSMTRVWTMAHRGGSKDYQEHSERGYLESAICHVDVMEMSLVRSKDGTFWGAHDNTANRTSSSVGPSAANGGTDWFFSDHTDAEIEALIQDLPSRGDSRFNTAKYYRLTDLVNRWSGTHTLMLDPKYISTAGRVDLYNYIKTIPDYKNRIMGKFYGTGIAIANEFHAIGCLVWGYFYTADVNNGDAAKYASYWDFLGLEYTASSSTWATMMSIADTKKVLGHIVPTAVAAQTAVGYGAKALQVSGVIDVSTVY